jgi:hypothetical protein
MTPPPLRVSGEFDLQEAAPTTERDRRRLLFGTLGGPLAWFAHLQANYALVSWACAHGHRFVLLLVPLAALVICVLAALAAWQAWPGSTQWRGEPHGIEGARMMSLVGAITSATFALVVIASAIPPFFLRPCD